MTTCEPIDCGVLQTPDKAEKVFETHTRVDGVVIFKCKEKGYEISGSEIRTCQNDESWSRFPTSCKIISCRKPGTPLHGKCEEWLLLPGFTMQGSSILTFARTGAWDKVKPSCTCERTNKEAFRYCRKQCNPDSGIGLLTCGSEGWTSRSFACFPKSCGNPGNHPNSKLKSYIFTFNKFILNATMATSLSETNTVNAKRIRDGVEKCQLVNQLIVECYKLLIRLKKYLKPTQEWVVSSDLSAKRKATTSVAPRFELVKMTSHGVDFQNRVKL
ncbi:hypothetical protein ACROYT_G017877 [Oculina patagonica]